MKRNKYQTLPHTVKGVYHVVVHEIDINIVTVAFHLILFNKITAKQQKSSGSLKHFGLNLKIRLFEGKQVVLHLHATIPSFLIS